jgi:hypothetical protein
MEALPTVRNAIFRQCVRCLCLPNARSGYDCLGRTCPLYPAMPWRGKHPPKTIQPNGPPEHEVERMAELAKTHPKRRPSRKMVHDQCMMCIADDFVDGKLVDCVDTVCPLYPLRPMQPGGTPKSQAHVRKYLRARQQGAPPIGYRKAPK